MKSAYLTIVTLTAILSSYLVRDFQENQALANEKRDLASRVETLEERTELMEKILFSSVKLETSRAKRALEDRRVQLKNSRNLFAKGLITQIQLQQDQLRVDIAKRELQVASSTSNQRQLVCELDYIEAQRELKMANEELAYRRNMARRGFLAQSEVDSVERWVDEAILVLEQAKMKLEAAKKFDTLKTEPSDKASSNVESEKKKVPK